MKYFAYGSNLNTAQMAVRCPGMRKLSPAILAGWQLVERFYADIDKAPGETVYGALYSVTEEDIANLDAYEGEGYRKETILVADSSGTLQEAFCYVMEEDYKNHLAGRRYTRRYRAICSAGAREWGIPDAFA